ncbi:MAG: NADH dehydrogenase FAD-containing subunit [Deltaproteobacteria bacterium]|nr:NADH dehydrogenase FAD-containing subunit [Deltaproteobacteria bacterium]
MMPLFLVIVPSGLGVVTLLIRGERRRKIRRLLMIVGALAHAAGTGLLHVRPEEGSLWGLIEVDPLGLLFLTITSLLFLIASVCSLGYFRHEYEKQETSPEGALRGRLHPALPVEGGKSEPCSDAQQNRRFCGVQTARAPMIAEGVSHLYTPCMLFLLAAMTLTTVASHVGVLWIAIEATTIASAPLIFYHRHHRALEAAWKYLLICSVGIAIALLGIFFVIAAGKANLSDLSFSSMIAIAKSLDPRWFRVGFLLILVGFGTKMGLAPLHSWLPDAHSEAPSPVSALLSGALLNCAFLGILRFYQIACAADLAGFAGRLLILLGLTSLAVAAVFITGQRDYKRLLAYSSVEHMGIMALGIGLGASFGSLLHAVNHSLTKGLLFFTAGQILIAYRTKAVADVHGLLKTAPTTGILLLVGGLAIVGAPPFAPFISEFLIFKEGLLRGHWIVCALYLLFLGIIFVAMSRCFLGMVQGEQQELRERSSRLMLLPPIGLAILVVVFGLYLPGPMVAFLKAAAGLIGGIS